MSRKLNEEQYRHVRENMFEEELVIFDILTRPVPELSADDRAEVKRVAREPLNRLKAVARPELAPKISGTLAIEDALDRLPAAYDRPLCAQKCSTLFEHMFESCPERDACVYATAM